MALPPNCRRITKQERTLSTHALAPVTQTSQAHFAIYDDAFLSILGPNPSLKCIVEKDYMFAHEAPVYIPAQDTVFFTTNTLRKPGPVIEIGKIARRERGGGEWEFEKLDTGIVMGNGGINWGEGEVLFCDQGDLRDPGGLKVMSARAPYGVETLVDGFHGRVFNSVNDVVVHSDGSVWFTDPTYGFQQGFRGEPQLPCFVYRFEVGSGDLRVVADGIEMPNGLCFSPDERVMYVTDTHCYHGSGGKDLSKASTIYAFDVVERHGGHFLENRRVFAVCDNGIPDGIKVDTDGFVYSGCGDGVQVWHPSGKLIGKIMTPGVVANFCFTRAGEMILLNEYRIWEVKISDKKKGALLHNLGVNV